MRPSAQENQRDTRRARVNPAIHEAKTTADTGVAKADAAQSYADTLVFVGFMAPYAGLSDPSDRWLLCDGRGLSAADYPDLFAALGSTYNTGGEAAGTFRIPDARGRALVGAGQGAGLTNRGLGSRFGAETHALTTNEMPAHDHGGDTSSKTMTHDHGGDTGTTSHNHTYVRGSDAGETVQSGTGAVVQGGEGTNFVDTTGSNTTHAHPIASSTLVHDHAVSSQGGGAAHNNAQPSLAVNYVIRVLP